MIPLDVILFYLFGGAAVACSLAVVLQRNPMHSVLLLIGSFLALAGLYVNLDAPFTAVTQIIVYAGAIMVLFVFVVMMLNLGEEGVAREAQLLAPRAWAGPAILCLVLLGQLWMLMHQGTLDAGGQPNAVGGEVTAKQVGIALYGPYLLAVELASMLLLGALVAAYHLGRHE
jgi:NADH-quinone oxidoreductase subunit J